MEEKAEVFKRLNNFYSFINILLKDSKLIGTSGFTCYIRYCTKWNDG